MRANEAIRTEAKKAGVLLWEIAECYGMQASNFSCKLRHELPEPERVIILGIIRQIAASRKEG